MTLYIYDAAGNKVAATDSQKAAARADLGAASSADLNSVADVANAAGSAAAAAQSAASAAQSTATAAGSAAAAAQATASAAYVKPANGIPHNDLHQGVRDQLDIAESALQPGALPAGTTVVAAQVSDASAAGRAVLTAADEAAQRAALGLSNVNNTSDASKPISNATQTALDGKLAANADAIADVLEAAATGAPADLARIQAAVSEYPALLQAQSGTGNVIVDRYPYTLFPSATAPAPLTVVNGEIVHTPHASANSAGYLQVDLGAPVTRIGAEVAWPTNNAGTAVTLVVPLTPWSSGVVTDAGLHITIYANGIWANEYLSPAAGGGITRTAYASNNTHGRFGYVGDGVFRDFEVTLDREHNRIAVRFPDGSISAHACPYLQYCGNYAIWELYEASGGATQPGKFRKIWADTKTLARNYRGDMDVFGPVFSGAATRSGGGNQTIYCDGTNVHFLPLTANLTGLATQGHRTGQEIELHIIQDATGGRTCTLGASFVLSGGAYTPTPTPNKRDILKFRHYLGTWYETGRVMNL